MSGQPDWNDWRAFLAVARSGSTLAAGRALRVSQTTVARRIAALEQALGIALFARQPAGYALTDAGSALLPDAEAIARAADAAEERARALGRDIRGVVRLSAEEIFAATLFPTLLRELQERHPAIRIELDASMAIRDLAAGEADIALRSVKEDQPPGVVGRIVGADRWSLYCSADYARRHGVPRRLAELRGHSIIGGGSEGLRQVYGEWLDRKGLADRVALEFGSSTGLLSAVRSGAGIATLPCLVADGDPDFVRCVPPLDYGRGLWLVTHDRVRRSAAVRAVIDFLYDRLVAHARRLDQMDAA